MLITKFCWKGGAGGRVSHLGSLSSAGLSGETPLGCMSSKVAVRNTNYRRDNERAPHSFEMELQTQEGGEEMEQQGEEEGAGTSWDVGIPSCKA